MSHELRIWSWKLKILYKRPFKGLDTNFLGKYTSLLEQHIIFIPYHAAKFSFKISWAESSANVLFWSNE